MTTLTDKLKGFVPMALGIYILMQGGALVLNSNLLIQLLGVGLLLWLPGCAYYTWRGFKPGTPREVTVQSMPHHIPTKLAA
jgi:hypothetical protein